VFATLTHRGSRLVALALVSLLSAAAPAAAHGPHHRKHHHRRHVTTPTVATVAAPGPCANANTPAAGAPAQEMRDAVVCLINQQRGKFRLPELTASSQLDRSAQGWTDQMVAQNVFTHGTDFSNRISAVGYDWSNAAENVGTGFATPQSVVTAWMASPDHCQNILSPVYADVGTGVNPNPVQAAATTGSTWTQDFGLLMSANQPSNNFGPANGCPYTTS
jgi:uncharacterized protein YkwD